MKRAVLIGGLLSLGCVLATNVPASAQYYERGRPSGVQVLNHDVQRLWDDSFHPRRYRDRRGWERRREVDRRSWCRDHGDFDRCGPYR